MPLQQGSSQEVISENIAELRHAGHSEAQAVAIAEHEAKDAELARVPVVGAKAAGIVYITDGRVLLLMRSATAENWPSVWGLPAGHVEEGESNEQAAVRESVEETGHAPSALVPLAADQQFAVFACFGDQFGAVLNDEHQGYLWAPIDALPEPIHPNVAEQVAMAWAKSQEPAEPLLAADSVAMDGLDAGFAMDKASVREIDTNGWAVIPRNPLSKVGVFTYSGRQVGDAANPDKPYRVYRPAEELSDPECIASFRLIPWIDNHVMLGSEEDGLMPAERKGVQGVIGEDVFFEGDTLYGNLKVFSQSMAGLIEAGKRELSCGYRCVYDFTPGTYRGEAYDCVQRTIRGNHLALVHSGRMGPDVAVLDSIDQSLTTTQTKEPPMADQKTGGGSGTALDAALDELKNATPEARKAHLAALRAVMDEAGDPKDDEKKEEKAEDADEDKDDADKKDAKDTDLDMKEDKADAKDSDMKMDDIAARPNAMDAAEVFKTVTGEIKRRDALAKQLSPHIGTFDHSDMTEAEVAAYGVKKLGLDAPKGQEAAMLAGFLKAKGAPESKTVKPAAAMDAGAADFVSAYLNQK